MSTTRDLDIPTTTTAPTAATASPSGRTTTVPDPGSVRARGPAVRARAGAPSGPWADPARAIVRVTHAEVVKLLGLRSTVIALAVAAFFVVGLGVVMTAGVAFDALGAADDSGAPPVAALDAPMGGVSSAYLAIAALGVLAVSAEYSTRTIRSTLAAVPRRAVLVVGKALAVTVVTSAVVLPSTLIAYVAGRLLLAAGGVHTEVAAADAVRVVVGAALYLAAVALVGSGFAWLLRSTAGALAAVLGLLVVVPALAMLLPPAVGARIAPFLPDAGAAVFQSVPATHPWGGLAVLAAYGVALLLAATARIDRRDS